MARSYEVIQAEILKLQQEAEEARSEERDAAIARIRKEMAHFGITPDELRGPVRATRIGAPTKKAAPARTKQSAQVATGASDDESPAVRMLEKAGIDFRRKNQVEAPAPGKPSVGQSKSAKTVASKGSRIARKVAPRKAAVKVGSKTKGAPTN